jgi:pyruvate,water dikinase
VYGQGARTTRSEATPDEDSKRFCLADEEVLTPARWVCLIKKHYSALAGRALPMDIEWAKDGII